MLDMPATIGSPALWGGFTAFVLLMLALDLGVFHRQAHDVKFREAVGWSIAWVALSALFALGLYVYAGPSYALEFTTGYLIEKALSVDNVFVFLVVFSFFAVPSRLQHRVLFWGVLGALVMRAAFILAGAALLERFHWIIYIFGAVLIVTAVKMARSGEDVNPERTLAYRLFRRFVPSTDGFRDHHFLVREGGRTLATPLLAVLVVIEATDLVFAVDSIPAIFAVTRDPFIVYTSNVFAILGLRAMFFLLAGVMDKFAYLKLGLALVLAFVGVKMLIVDIVHIPIALSLAAVALIIGGAIGASLLWPPRSHHPAP